MVKYNIAIVGAVNQVSEEILDILNKRDFPLGDLFILDIGDNIAKTVEFQEKNLEIDSLDKFDFSKVDISFFTGSNSMAKDYATKAVAQGSLVIDSSDHFKNNHLVPMIIPQINLAHLEMYKNMGIVTTPSSLSLQVLTALSPIHNKYGVSKVFAATYQSVSNYGNDALDELFNQTRGVFFNESITKTKKVFTKQIAFNAIPHVGEFLENGSTKEEWNLWFEAKKILDSNIEVNSTCVHIPVFVSDAVNLNIELLSECDEDDIQAILKETEGISVVDYRANEGYVTPIEVAGEDNIYVSRIRKNINDSNSLNMWVVADNIRRGIALNMVIIAEKIIVKE